jgi:hypothetical protein
MWSREVQCEDCGTIFEVEPDEFNLTRCVACDRLAELEAKYLEEEEEEE